jgi:hypothetical protein
MHAGHTRTMLVCTAAQSDVSVHARASSMEAVYHGGSLPGHGACLCGMVWMFAPCPWLVVHVCCGVALQLVNCPSCNNSAIHERSRFECSNQHLVTAAASASPSQSSQITGVAKRQDMQNSFFLH